MTATSELESRVERLIACLAGVVSVRAIAGDDGRVQEIHVLTTPELQPKQVVRNVESALSAGLGLEIDRRIVSVAQVRDARYADVPTQLPLEERTTPAAQPQRLVLVRHDTWTLDGEEAHCRVVVRRDAEEFVGVGAGSSSANGRAAAAARALFAAMAGARSEEDLALEDAAVVETQGRSFVLVAAHALTGRHTVPLTGVAAVSRSPEEAAILAALQATNRWAELPG